MQSKSLIQSHALFRSTVGPLLRQRTGRVLLISLLSKQISKLCPVGNTVMSHLTDERRDKAKRLTARVVQSASRGERSLL
jgi:hypothetical protein